MVLNGFFVFFFSASFLGYTKLEPLRSTGASYD
jgi:hypothetical protein